MTLRNAFADLATEETQQIIASAVGTRDEPALSTQPGVAVFAVRRDSDTIPTDDGDLSMLHVDEGGRLKVSPQSATFPVVSGVANTVASTVVVDVRRASNIVFHVRNVGSVTLSAGTFVWEGSVDSTNGSDGTWFGIQAVRMNANTIETQIALSGMTAGSGYTSAWEASVNALAWVRIRCSVAVTASASASWTILRGTYATEPVPAIQTHAVTQSGAWTVASTTATGTAVSIVSAASTNATLVKSSAGSLFELVVSNVTAATIYLKLYNKASAPTVGTDIPVMTVAVTAGATLPVQFGAIGKRFGVGIGLAITANAAASDTTAITAGAQVHGTFV